jgi:hypothetical protein
LSRSLSHSRDTEVSALKTHPGIFRDEFSEGYFMDLTGLFGLKDVSTPGRFSRRQTANEWLLVAAIVMIAVFLHVYWFCSGIRNRSFGGR